MGALLVGLGTARAADPAAASDGGKPNAAPSQGRSQDAGATGALPAREISQDAAAAEPSAAKQPSTAASEVEPAAAPGPAQKPAEPAKAADSLQRSSAPAPTPAPAPAVEARPAKPAAAVAGQPKKDLGLMLAGTGAALAGAAAMGIGMYYLHVDGRQVCKPGEIEPCDFVRDTRTLGDVMLASGSGVFLLGAAAFFWGFYSDTMVAVAPTGMMVTGRF
jgi:hypothetical protein